MVTETIRGIQVEFPFKPYPVQLAYMDKVLESLTTGTHAVLESPTGTGKTLSLLCSTLAWLKKTNLESGSSNLYPSSERHRDPNEDMEVSEDLDIEWGGKVSLKRRIIYSSRTHTQLSKAMKELQNTAYKSVNITVLGSRDQLCIHPEVSKEPHLSTKNAQCRMRVRAKTCKLANKVETAINDPALINGIVDVEDLLQYGKQNSCCPYYLSRDLQDRADIIFMPYNYLFDSSIRKKLNINLQSSVVILDEGHNIDKICEESVSFALLNTEIAVAIDDIKKEMEDFYEDASGSDNPVQRNYTPEDLVFVQECLLTLEEQVDRYCGNETYPGSKILEIFNTARITQDTWRRCVQTLSSVCEILQHKSGLVIRQGIFLNKIANILIMLFSLDPAKLDCDFKTCFVKLDQSSLRTGEYGWTSAPEKQKITMHFWCFNPQLGMSELLNNGKIHSLILTSGTLTPIPVTVRELGLGNPLTIECSHIIEPNQVALCVVESGPSNIKLDSRYNNRDNVDYYHESGRVLQNYIRIIPDGVLVFYPSYRSLNKAVSVWQECGIWNKMCLIKPFFVEESAKSFDKVLVKYKESIESGKGGVLIGVLRGKVSEGMDFSDYYGRAVLIFGIPYPPFYEKRVVLKKQYLDENSKRVGFNGDCWYTLEATRAVNQAIGRVIRHSNDFGVVLLCEARYNQPHIIQCISKWLKPQIKRINNFGESMALLRDFFKNNKDRMTAFQQMTPIRIPNTSAGSESSLSAPKSYYLGPSTSSQSGFVDALKSLCSNVSDSPTKPSSILEKKQPSSSSGSIFSKLQNMDENDAPTERPRSCFSLGPINPDISQPAKRRKILVKPLVIGDIKATSNDPVAKAKAQKLNEAKNFLIELKNTLEEESYAQFDLIVRCFQKDQDLPSALKKLKILFPSNDVYFSSVFKDCEKLFSGHQLKQFQEFYNTEYLSN